MIDKLIQKNLVAPCGWDVFYDQYIINNNLSKFVYNFKLNDRRKRRVLTLIETGIWRTVHRSIRYWWQQRLQKKYFKKTGRKNAFRGTSCFDMALGTSHNLEIIFLRNTIVN